MRFHVDEVYIKDKCVEIMAENVHELREVRRDSYSTNNGPQVVSIEFSDGSFHVIHPKPGFKRVTEAQIRDKIKYLMNEPD